MTDESSRLIYPFPLFVEASSGDWSCSRPRELGAMRWLFGCFGWIKKSPKNHDNPITQIQEQSDAIALPLVRCQNDSSATVLAMQKPSTGAESNIGDLNKVRPAPSRSSIIADDNANSTHNSSMETALVAFETISGSITTAPVKFVEDRNIPPKSRDECNESSTSPLLEVELEAELEVQGKIKQESEDAQKLQNEVNDLQSCGTLLQTPEEIARGDDASSPLLENVTGWHSWLTNPLSNMDKIWVEAAENNGPAGDKNPLLYAPTPAKECHELLRGYPTPVLMNSPSREKSNNFFCNDHTSGTERNSNEKSITPTPAKECHDLLRGYMTPLLTNSPSRRNPNSAFCNAESSGTERNSTFCPLDKSITLTPAKECHDLLQGYRTPLVINSSSRTKQRLQSLSQSLKNPQHNVSLLVEMGESTGRIGMEKGEQDSSSTKYSSLTSKSHNNNLSDRQDEKNGASPPRVLPTEGKTMKTTKEASFSARNNEFTQSSSHSSLVDGGEASKAIATFQVSLPPTSPCQRLEEGSNCDHATLDTTGITIATPQCKKPIMLGNKPSSPVVTPVENFSNLKCLNESQADNCCIERSKGLSSELILERENRIARVLQLRTEDCNENFSPLFGEVVIAQSDGSKDYGHGNMSGTPQNRAYSDLSLPHLHTPESIITDELSSIHINNASDRPILGTVATYWNSLSSSSGGGKWWDGNGIPNSTTKYRENQKVNWRSTPFEVRVERELEKEAVMTQKNLFGGVNAR